MSTKKYANAQFILDALIDHWNIKGYSDLAVHLGVPYQTLMAWKKRGRIGDYAPFMDKGILLAWLETGEGEMVLPPKPVVEYNNSDHEEDNEFVKPVTRYEFEQFSSLRPDQKKMLAVWENLDCEQRIALMAWAKLFTKG